MSTVKANTYQDASGGNTATINSMTPTADSLQGFRNRIINGDMRIDQRNAGAAVTLTSSTSYTVDRWAGIEDTDGAMTAQQDTSAPTGFVNSLKFTTTTADSSLSALQYARVHQRIEGTNVADLAWGTANAKTVTLSFWVRSSLTGTFGGAFTNSAFDRSYPFTYTISVANTWEYKTVTITGDTSGTWLTTTGTGIQIIWGLGVGSTYSGTAGSWAGTGYLSATGATSVIGTLNATFFITGVQLEVGSTATPFERRPYGTELMLCQRYFEKSFEMATAPAQNTGSYSGTAVASSPGQLSGMSFGDTRFKVNKRVSPSITFYNPAAANAFARDQNAGVDCSATSAWVIGESAFAITASTGSGSGATNRIGVHWIASAEL